MSDNGDGTFHILKIAGGVPGGEIPHRIDMQKTIEAGYPVRVPVGSTEYKSKGPQNVGREPEKGPVELSEQELEQIDSKLFRLTPMDREFLLENVKELEGTLSDREIERLKEIVKKEQMVQPIKLSPIILQGN